jgi:hypothetical protein
MRMRRWLGLAALAGVLGAWGCGTNEVSDEGVVVISEPEKVAGATGEAPAAPAEGAPDAGEAGSTSGAD